MAEVFQHQNRGQRWHYTQLSLGIRNRVETMGKCGLTSRIHDLLKMLGCQPYLESKCVKVVEWIQDMGGQVYVCLYLAPSLMMVEDNTRYLFCRARLA